MSNLPEFSVDANESEECVDVVVVCAILKQLDDFRFRLLAELTLVVD